jgi:hypothetical protein
VHPAAKAGATLRVTVVKHDSTKKVNQNVKDVRIKAEG